MEIDDRRFIGFFDSPPEDLTYKGKSMVHFGYDVWANGKSMFSPDFRWALVLRKEVGA